MDLKKKKLTVSVKHQYLKTVSFFIGMLFLALCFCDLLEILSDFRLLQVESSLKNTCKSTSVPIRSASTKPSSATALFSRDPLEKKPSLCILVDSREISSGAEVISSLKAVHGVKVQVCSLSSSDYIVSNRMAVERKFLSELLNSVNRNKVTQRIQRLQSMFERICVIVEKDRIKPGRCSQAEAAWGRTGLCSRLVLAILALCIIRERK